MRYVAGTGIDVYDTDSDQWYRIEDEQERANFLAYAEALPEPEKYSLDPPPINLVMPERDELIESRGASDYATAAYSIVDTVTPICVLGRDVQRRHALFYCQSSGGAVLIGPRQGLANNGMFMQNGVNWKFETTDEVWAIGSGAIANVVLYVAVFRNA